jgi:hypothetical protein
MTRPWVAIPFALLLLAAGPVAARDGRGGGAPRSSGGAHGGSHHGWHGGSHHHHHFGGSGVFFYGSYGPYWYPGWGYRPYFYPYYPYYPYYPVYSYPPPWVREPDDDEDDDERADAPPAEMEQASYGLVRLDGIRDGAAVELDGRFWLTAHDLDDRWLALPQGEHRIVVRVREGELIERTVRIVPGRTHVLKFGANAEPRT